MPIRIKTAAYLSGIFCLALLIKPAQAETYKQAEYIMGTVFEITLDTHKSITPAEQAKTFGPLFKKLRAYDNALSNYKPQSDLNRMTRAIQKKSPLPLPDILCTSLIQASAYHAFTQGAFDISVGPLVKLWGFKNKQFRVPTPHEVTRVQKQAGLKKVRFDAAACVLKQLPTEDNALDFGAMGKGAAIDGAILVFKNSKPSQNIAGLAINGGGSSAYFWGAPVATPQGWPVIGRSSKTVLPASMRWLKNQALGVSGTDQQFFMYRGKRYGHILDPRTGYPVKHNPYGNSFYVVADTAVEADIFSTTLHIVNEASRKKLSKRFGFTYWQTQ